MEDITTKPLLSDEQVYGLPRVERIAGRDIAYYPNMMRGDFVRDRYESARSKDTDLIKATFKELNEIHTLLENASWNYADGTTKGEGEADKLGRVIHLAETRLSEVLQRINDRSK